MKDTGEATVAALHPVPCILYRGQKAAASEKALNLLERLEQAIHLFQGIINRERRPRGAGDAEPVHQRHAAMMAGAHRHTLLVEQGANIGRVGAVQQEGKYTHLGLSLIHI